MGDDQFGYMLADILKENKVNNSGMRFDHKAGTALAFISLKSDGEREFLFFRNPSADMLLQESELDVNLIKQVCSFLFIIILWLIGGRPAHNLSFCVTYAGKNISLWFD